MTVAAPRVDSRLHAALSRLDDGSLPIAEVYRRLGLVAEHLQLARPSYEHVRRLVHAQRRRGRYPSAGGVLLDIALNTRPPSAIMEHLLGTLPPEGRVR